MNDELREARSILTRLWQNQRVLAPALARFVLLGAGVATLVACFTDGGVARLCGALAVAGFPPALMLLAEPGDRVPRWIVGLASSLAAGMAIAVLWSGSPFVAGLPLATWLTWILLGAFPFALVLYGIVLGDRGSR